MSKKNLDFDFPNEVVGLILERAFGQGVHFLVFGGMQDGQLDFHASDIDVFCETKRDIDQFCAISQETMAEHKECRFIDVRRNSDGVQLIYLIGDLPIMLDLVYRFSLDGIEYVDSESVFSLIEHNVDIRSLLREIKHLTNAKKAWPQVPKFLYSMKRIKANLFLMTFVYLRKVLRLISGYFSRRQGVMVVFLGLDGSGKSSVIYGLINKWYISRSIIPMSFFHWRPRLTFSRKLPAISSAFVNPIPHAKAQRNYFSSTIKLIYLFFMFNVGYIMSLRPLLVRNAVILGDRYFHDMLIDSRRYRYGGSLYLAQLIGKMIPKPDIFIYLDVPADVAYARKPEIPLDSAEQLRKNYLSFSSTGNQETYIVDADRPLNIVISDAEKIIFGYLEKRNKTLNWS